MNSSMNISKTGIHAQQRALNLISNNIANVSTQGFKAKNVQFQSLLSNDIVEDNRLLTEEHTIPTGVRSQQSGMNIGPGSFHEGVQSVDLTIKGDGFFGIQNAAGDLFLTKDGSFSVDAAGQLVNSNGDYLVIDGQAPFIVEDPQNFTITTDGKVVSLNNGEMTPLGSIPLYQPDNIQDLRAEGNNYYAAPEEGLTIIDATNSLEVGYLERSNVDLAKEFTDMIVAQRAYALNVKVAQATDEIKTMTNQFS